MTNRFPNFTSAYYSVLKELASNGIHVGSTIEILGHSFVVDSPRDRGLFLSSRQIDLPFAIFSTVWTMTGASDFKQVELCLKDPQITGDRTELYCGYGKRLLNQDSVNQVATVIDRLKKDPFSRRAVAVIYLASDNQMPGAGSARIPCPIGIQFFVREDKLSAVSYMRSQSAAMFLPYDVFALTFLQEIVAVALGLDMGPYYHMCGSLHYYSQEEELIQKIIADENYDSAASESAPRMPSDVNPFEMISIITSMEIIQDQAADAERLARFQMPEVPRYWQDLILIMLSRIAENSGVENSEYYSQLPDYYHWYFRRSQRVEP